MPEYFDPQLWVRLEPKIIAEHAQRVEHVAAGAARSLEQYREMVGYVRALKWVMDTARELTHMESNDDVA
jgi:hypothetical protein